MSVFSAFVLVGSVQGILLSFALRKLKGRDMTSNKYLVLFLLAISITLLGRFFYADTALNPLKFKILFFGDTIIFLYGPLLYLWLSRLLGKKEGFKKKELLHFVPALIFFISLLPLFIAPANTFYSTLNTYGYIYTIEEILAIGHNLIYIFLSVQMLNRYENEHKQQSSLEPQTRFYKILVFVSLGTVIVWLVSFFLSRFLMNYAYGISGYHLIWFIMSTTIFVLGYYTIGAPEIFHPLIKKEEATTKQKKEIEDLEKYIHSIERVINDKKPYLDPRLKLADLSEICGIRTHLLSRIINEYYEKNFFDFINTYRTNEFISKINKESLSQFTILKLALESGFNSKTTFNTAFKKHKGLTPKEYITREMEL